MTNILCVKWGTKYSSQYVNNLYAGCKKYYPSKFKFICYTDDTNGINPEIVCHQIESDLEGWWLKLECLNLYNDGTNILLDLDLVFLNKLERLNAVKTRTVSVLYSSWKEGYLQPRAREIFPTLYNSSVMKWEGNQGGEIFKYFQKHKDMILFKYQGIDRFLFNEPVDVDLLPTGIAYSYWKGVRYMKDTTPEKLRDDYEICIVNHNPKPHEIDTWIRDYWNVSEAT